MDFDASPELVVYSKEYDPAVGQYYFQVTVVDGKTLTAQWSFQSAYELDQVMLGNIDLDEPQEVISVCKSTNTTTVRDNDGTILWAKDYGEPVVATVISDQNDDGANDLLVFSTTCYTDLFGNYWWKYFMEDVEDDTTIVSGNAYLPNTIYPYRVLAVDWNLTTPSEEIISFDMLYEDECSRSFHKTLGQRRPQQYGGGEMPELAARRMDGNKYGCLGGRLHIILRLRHE